MNSQQFIDALHQLEDRNDLDTIAGLFGDNASVTNPHLDEQNAGPDGARSFWQQYRSTFGTIHSDFQNVIESDSSAALEWESEGTLKPGGQPIRYRGVSILEWSGDKLTRFAAYYDSDMLRVEHT